MPGSNVPSFAENRGYRIAFETIGNGPPVVLQHGILMNRRNWIESGFADALSQDFRLILVDSLGHGDSDKPDDPLTYRRRFRAGDIAAVMDQLGIARAHYVGYSMGGWIGTGVAKYHPERLLSLTLGGWDPVNGIETQNRALGVHLTLDTIVAGARSVAPELASWITAQVEPGLRACWDALTEIDGSREALANCGVPVLLWDGVEDPFHGPANVLGQELSNASFLSVQGDHLGAMTAHATESARGLRDFLGRIRDGRG